MLLVVFPDVQWSAEDVFTSVRTFLLVIYSTCIVIFYLRSFPPENIDFVAQIAIY